jgi:hypothetical protein
MSLLIGGIVTALVAAMSIEDLAWMADGGGVERSSYSPPLTPWGDPDLQGAYTNPDERDIPLEKPPDPPIWGRLMRRFRAAPRNDLHDVPREPTFEGSPKHSRHWLVSDPPDGRIPPRVSAFRGGAATTTPQEVRVAAPWVPLGLFARCISRGMPGSMMPTIYGNVYDITQAPGVVAIRYEMINETRVIPLDGRPHVGPGMRSYMGDARGWFEGNTLVVETTNLTDKTAFLGSSEDLRLVERFTPVSPHTLEWSVTVDDPATWTSPWTFAMNLTRSKSRPLEFACHEGNYAMRHMLATH